MKSFAIAEMKNPRHAKPQLMRCSSILVERMTILFGRERVIDLKNFVRIEM